MPTYESSGGKIFLYFAVWNLRNHKGPYSDNRAEDCGGDLGGREGGTEQKNAALGRPRKRERGSLEVDAENWERFGEISGRKSPDLFPPWWSNNTRSFAVQNTKWFTHT